MRIISKSKDVEMSKEDWGCINTNAIKNFLPAAANSNSALYHLNIRIFQLTEVNRSIPVLTAVVFHCIRMMRFGSVKIQINM